MNAHATILARPAGDDFSVEALVPGFQPPFPPAGASPGPAELRRADRAARAWHGRFTHWPENGSAAQAQALHDLFHDTFNPYRPAVIDWPALAPEDLARLVALPIWDIAVQTEGRARLYMAAYAATVRDPAMREALALNAWEESRHKEVLARMVAAYGIALEPEPAVALPGDREWAYLVTGFSECVDSFFAFGLFALAKRSGLFPPALVETFEPVMQEECRHILLFANWLAWHRARLGLLARLRFEAKVLRVWAFLGLERIGLARSLDGDKTKQDSNFAMTGASAVTTEDFDLATLLSVCLAENDRRFAGYDPRLARPATMPALARRVLRVLRWARAKA